MPNRPFWADYFGKPAILASCGQSRNHFLAGLADYCSLISTSTPAGRSSFISASTVLSVGSTMSIRR